MWRTFTKWLYNRYVRPDLFALPILVGGCILLLFVYMGIRAILASAMEPAFVSRETPEEKEHRYKAASMITALAMISLQWAGITALILSR